MPRLYSAAEAARLIEAASDVDDEVMSDEASDVSELAIEENSTSDDSQHVSSSDEEINDHVPDQYVSRSGDNWSSIQPPLQGRNRNADILRQNGGPTRYAIQRIDSLSDSWELIINNNILEIIVDSTNRQAHRILGVNFTNVTLSEMRAFIGLVYLRGIYQGTNEPLQNLWNPRHGREVFSSTLGFQRFKSILKYIRFDDRAQRNARYRNDKFSAIREVFTLFQDAILRLYWPHENITVDEQLFPSRNRCSFLQYMPMKPTKFGIKFWIAADSLSRYVLTIDPYLGKNNDDPLQEGPLGEKVVLRLTRSYNNSGCNIVTDNFFTSISLARKLYQNQMTILGTIRKNRREIPRELLDIGDRARYSSKFAFHNNNEAVVVSYLPKRNKNVLLLSSKNFRAAVDETSDKKKPLMILEYNKLKGGVDSVDQMLRHFTTKMASRRWPLAVFCNLLDIAALNAYTLWKDINNSPNLPRFKFIHELSCFLIQEQQNIKTQGTILVRVPRIQPLQLDNEQNPHPDHEPQRKRGNCQFCDHGKRNKTMIKCSVCQKWICGAHVAKKNNFCNTCAHQ